MKAKERQRLERKIIRCALNSIVAEGYSVRIHNGEDYVGEVKSRDVKKLMTQIMSTDEDTIDVYHPANPNGRFGWVHLVYGNDGHDVIQDHSTNLTDVLEAATKMADREAENATNN